MSFYILIALVRVASAFSYYSSFIYISPKKVYILINPNFLYKYKIINILVIYNLNNQFHSQWLFQTFLLILQNYFKSYISIQGCCT